MPVPLQTASPGIAPAFCTVSANQRKLLPTGLLEVGCVGVTIQSQFGVGRVSPREVRGEVPHSAINGLPAKEVGSYRKALRGPAWWESRSSLAFEVTPSYVQIKLKQHNFNKIHIVKRWCF